MIEKLFFVLLLTVSTTSLSANQSMTESPKELILHANQKLQQGDTKKALGLVNKAIQMDSKIWQAYFLRGLIHKSLGQHDKEVLDFSKVVELNPYDFESYVNRGHAKLGLNDPEGALIDLNKAISINSKFALAYQVRGMIHETLKKYNKSIEDYDHAITLNPSSKRTDLLGRGFAKNGAGDLKGACEDWKEALKLGNPVVGKLIKSHCESQ